MKNNAKVYGLFYKSHGTWTPYSNNQTLSLNGARQVKRQVRKAYKSSVIIRKVKFV
jgi:hypothetical protein